MSNPLQEIDSLVADRGEDRGSSAWPDLGTIKEI